MDGAENILLELACPGNQTARKIVSLGEIEDHRSFLPSNLLPFDEPKLSNCGSIP
jgi:hypothetical protein